MKVEVGCGGGFYENFDGVFQILYDDNRLILKYHPDDDTTDTIINLARDLYVIIDE